MVYGEKQSTRTARGVDGKDGAINSNKKIKERMKKSRRSRIISVLFIFLFFCSSSSLYRFNIYYFNIILEYRFSKTVRKLAKFTRFLLLIPI